MKGSLRNWLKQNGWYEHLRYSILFDLYVSLFKRHVIQAHLKEVNFYKSFLSPCTLIFDIGDGHKTAAFLELAGKVVACEPDKQNSRTLRIRFRNELGKRVIVEPKAVSDRTGTATYYEHQPGSAFNTLNTKWKEILEADDGSRWNETIRFGRQTEVSVTTLDALIQQYGKPGFIKIDVEGFEQYVLKGLSEKVPCISFECLLPDCKAELMTCLDHLQGLDKGVMFNAAYDESLLFDGFIGYDDMIAWVNGKDNPSCFEVVAKWPTE